MLNKNSPSGLMTDISPMTSMNEVDELRLSYAVIVHTSQGCEYPALIIPIDTQQYALMQRNLLYTAITRGRKLVVLVGTRKTIAIAVKRVDSRRRVTLLKERLVQLPPGRCSHQKFWLLLAHFPWNQRQPFNPSHRLGHRLTLESVCPSEVAKSYF